MNRTIRIFSICLLLVLLVTLAGKPSAAYAASTTLNSVSQGWIHSSGFQIVGNPNYLVGYAGNEYRDYFVFNLSGVRGTVIGATLRVNVGMFDSLEGFETVAFYDVTTPASDLINGTGGSAAYNDLGTGTLLGTVTVTGAQAYRNIDIPLNADGVAAVGSALGGTFALGGALVTYNDNLEYVFADSMYYTAQLIVITDTTPPVVSVPSNMVVEAVDASGATVEFSASATDETAPANPAVTCVPPSGSTFALDASVQVTCSATDNAGNTGYGYFQVQVVDTTAPLVTVPSDISIGSANPSGEVVNYVASAADLVDGSLAPSCDWPSGSTFPSGTTLVTCSATDAHGNTGSATFNVTIAFDNTPPEFSLVLDNPYEATGPSGAIVNYNASFSDSGSGMASSSCTPASGSLFPIGSTTVNCTGTDNVGNTSTPSFEVIVQDTTAPQLNLPADIFVGQSLPEGAVVNYEVTATDLVSSNPVVACVPASGSTFPIGVTTVDCSASDDFGNTSTGSFTVTVSALSTAAFGSIGRYDGTVRESRESSNTGGSANASSGFLDVGDGTGDVQVLSILHFDTSSLPDNAVITGVSIQIKQYRVTGSNPFVALGNLLVDIASPYFGLDMGLKAADFQAPAAAPNVGFFNPTPLPNNWFKAVLDPASFSSLNAVGPTQFRLRFALDDNDDGRNNLVRFYSGEAVNPAFRPVLIVEYYVP